MMTVWMILTEITAYMIGHVQLQAWHAMQHIRTCVYGLQQINLSPLFTFPDWIGIESDAHILNVRDGACNSNGSSSGTRALEMNKLVYFIWRGR